VSRRPTPSVADRAAPAPRGADGFRPAVTTAEKTTRWEDAHTRVTFHCPVDVLEGVEDLMSRTGQSKSGLIVEALRAYLGGKRR
jgi:ribbon-helix-helix CopG family protein